jgi:hypothetical protein
VLPCGARRRCFISASNYDSSCTVDSDCVAVTETDDWCASDCLCGRGFLNKKSAAQYVQEAARTPLGSGAVAPGFCGCPLSPPPCCVQGQCTVTGCGSTPTPVDDASAEPGDLGYTVLCVGDAGPVDAGVADTPATPGVSRWCNGPEVCTSFNGGWACCVLNPAPVVICVLP